MVGYRGKNYLSQRLLDFCYFLYDILEDTPRVAAENSHYFVETIFDLHIIYVSMKSRIIIFSSRCLTIPIQPPQNAGTSDNPIDCLRCANMIYE
jgi:hypothetical protein